MQQHPPAEEALLDIIVPCHQQNHHDGFVQQQQRDLPTWTQQALSQILCRIVPRIMLSHRPCRRELLVHSMFSTRQRYPRILWSRRQLSSSDDIPCDYCCIWWVYKFYAIVAHW